MIQLRLCDGYAIHEPKAFICQLHQQKIESIPKVHKIQSIAGIECLMPLMGVSSRVWRLFLADLGSIASITSRVMAVFSRCLADFGSILAAFWRISGSFRQHWSSFLAYSSGYQAAFCHLQATSGL